MKHIVAFILFIYSSMFYFKRLVTSHSGLSPAMDNKCDKIAVDMCSVQEHAKVHGIDGRGDWYHQVVVGLIDRCILEELYPITRCRLQDQRHAEGQPQVVEHACIS